MLLTDIVLDLNPAHKDGRLIEHFLGLISSTYQVQEPDMIRILKCRRYRKEMFWLYEKAIKDLEPTAQEIYIRMSGGEKILRRGEYFKTYQVVGESEADLYKIKSVFEKDGYYDLNIFAGFGLIEGTIFINEAEKKNIKVGLHLGALYSIEKAKLNDGDKREIYSSTIEK